MEYTPRLASYTVIKRFKGGSDGGQPTSGLVLSGGALYGTTAYGGSSGKGTVFKVNTNGTGYTVLKSFTGSDGAFPAGLVLSGGTLYGTTGQGGRSGNGTVFKVNTDGTGYIVLKSFTGSDGQNPLATQTHLVVMQSRATPPISRASRLTRWVHDSQFEDAK